MKKVRMMLLAIAVIAIASGTLAFKAKFDTDICVGPATTTNPGTGVVYTCVVDEVFTATCDELQTAVITETLNPINPQLCFTIALEDENGDPFCEADDTDCILGTILAEEGGE